MKFCRAFRDVWAPMLFFAFLLGFIGLGISHVDAKVRAEETKSVIEANWACSFKWETDEDVSEECSQPGAAQFNRIEYGSLRSLFLSRP